MPLIGWLTLAYAAVLVLVLAASLTAIWVYLVRIGSVLARVRATLALVADRTAPLEGVMARLGRPCEPCLDDLQGAVGSLDQAAALLETILPAEGARRRG